MFIQLPKHKLFAYTGGKPFNPAQPTAVFIHGVLNDHSVWILQTRYLAHHGWNVLAIDLPGHCKSEGPPPESVEQAAATVIAASGKRDHQGKPTHAPSYPRQLDDKSRTTTRPPCR